MCRKRIKEIFAGKLNGLLIAEKACKQSNRKQTDISSVLEALQINIAGLFLTRVGLTLFSCLPQRLSFSKMLMCECVWRERKVRCPEIEKNMMAMWHPSACWWFIFDQANRSRPGLTLFSCIRWPSLPLQWDRFHVPSSAMDQLQFHLVILQALCFIVMMYWD